jgi:hypothetical protein
MYNCLIWRLLEMEKNDYKFFKAGFFTTILIVLISVLILLSNMNYLKDDSDSEPVVKWDKIQEVSWDTVGENDPGPEGWLSTFHLDYGQDPDTVLANNATDWSTSPNARGYVDSDNAETDLKSEDPSYICVRCRFDDDSKESGSWNWSRLRVNLTVSGDETISDVGEYDNSSSAGDAVISASTSNQIYINFYWDDGVDGYRITDDGSLIWSITIWEKK